MSEKDKKPKRPVRGRVFQCTGFPNCNKSFTRSEHLARHRRKHTGERPFTCPHCSKNFSRLDNLRQHKQTVHAYENYIKKRPQGQLARTLDQGDLPPGTPRQFGPKMFSPPSLDSPQYPLVYYGYYGPGDGHRVGQNQDLSQRLQPIHHQSQLRNSITDKDNLKSEGDENDSPDRLRDPPKFNSKNRPKPLALVHSFVDDSAINNRTNTPKFVVEPPLKTAPALSLFPAYSPTYGVLGHGLAYEMGTGPGFGLGIPHGYGNGLANVGNRPGTAHGFKFHHFNSMMVSPLLPLFHQLFNQVASNSSTFFALRSVSRLSSALALALNLLTPSLATLESEKDLTEDNNDSLDNLNNPAAVVTEKQNEMVGEEKKACLRILLNDEPKKLAINSLITSGEEANGPSMEVEED